MAGVDYAAQQLPSEQQYLTEYCRLMHREPLTDKTWAFFMAFSMFRLAAILQGILRRARDGNAASADAEQTGQRARAIAAAAWRQL
jgi:aminoglycoside phosphotransferase (APT) family kinase protein